MRSKLTVSAVVLALSLGAYGWLHAMPMTPQFSYSTASFLAQHGNLTETPLFTPTVDGNYQVTVNVEFVSTCCASVAPVLSWSDNTNSYSVVPNTFSSITTNYQAPTVNMHVKAGSPVRLSTEFFNAFGTSDDSYNVFVTVIGN